MTTHAEQARSRMIYGMGGHEPADRTATRIARPPGTSKAAERLRERMGGDAPPKKDGA